MLREVEGEDGVGIVGEASALKRGEVGRAESDDLVGR